MPQLQLFTPTRTRDFVERVHAHTRRQLIDLTLERTRANQALIQRAFGHEAPTELFVDGQSGKPLMSAQTITLTQFHLQNGVVDAAHRMLVERSPYGPDKHGHYQDDHWIFVNGVRRDATREGGKPIDIGPHDKVIIVNMRPYARKIEGGPNQTFRRRLTDRRPGISAQAPNGVYEITARDLQRAFGKVADIRFTYHGVIGGTLVFAPDPRPAMRGRHGRFTAQGGPRPANAKLNRFPALEIESRLF
jgi:hypothetical protein